MPDTFLATTTQTKRGSARNRRPKTATVEEAAAVPFDPWPEEIVQKMAETLADTYQPGTQTRIDLHAAAEIMGKDKSALIKAVAGLANTPTAQGGDLASALHDQLRHTAGELQAWAEVLNAAASRLLCAGAAAALADAD